MLSKSFLIFKFCPDILPAWETNTSIYRLIGCNIHNLVPKKLGISVHGKLTITKLTKYSNRVFPTKRNFPDIAKPISLAQLFGKLTALGQKDTWSHFYPAYTFQRPRSMMVYFYFQKLSGGKRYVYRLRVDETRLVS